MNQLPEVFPIRYAIILNARNDKNLDNKLLLPDPKVEMLFRQYILKLQKEPLSKSGLRPRADYIKASFQDIDIAYLAKLEGEEGWLKTTSDKLTSILPGIKINFTGTGFFIETSLYSYRGAYEIPSFVKFKKEEDKIGFYEVERKYNIKSLIYRYFYDKYKEILEDKVNSWELYQILARYKQPIRIEAPYSEIWEFLDAGKNNGFISSNIYRTEDKIIHDSLPDKIKKSNSKIEIVICRSWKELFAEELSALYKTLKRCRNCNKPLPFKYKGNYCPDLSENKNCIKERNRKRKSQARD